MYATARWFLLTAALLAVTATNARAAIPAPTWDRAQAVAAARVDVVGRLKPLYALARAGHSEALLSALQAIGNDRSLSDPARERLLHAFTAGLSDLPARAVEPAVLEYLGSIPLRTLVPHPDRPDVGVPLFNVRAAAAGVEAVWTREEARNRALTLLDGEPAGWIAGFADAGTLQREGFLAALDAASPGQLRGVATLALSDSERQPVVARIAVRASLLLEDPGLFQSAVAAGAQPGTATALRSAGRLWDEETRAAMLTRLVDNAPPTVAALSLAELAPALLGRPDIRDLLFGLLGEPGLGAAAALTLSASTDPAVRARLSTLASDHQDLTGKRAALALDSRRPAAGGGVE